jgi:hypothetical protein
MQSTTSESCGLCPWGQPFTCPSPPPGGKRLVWAYLSSELCAGMALPVPTALGNQKPLRWVTWTLGFSLCREWLSQNIDVPPPWPHGQCRVSSSLCCPHSGADHSLLWEWSLSSERRLLWGHGEWHGASWKMCLACGLSQIAPGNSESQPSGDATLQPKCASIMACIRTWFNFYLMSHLLQWDIKREFAAACLSEKINCFCN